MADVHRRTAAQFRHHFDFGLMCAPGRCKDDVLGRAADKLDSASRFSVPQRVARFLLAEADENEGKQSVGARQATSRIRPASRARPSPQP